MPAHSPQTCVADFIAAMIGRDMDAALAQLTDEVVFFYSNGTTLVGQEAFAALMTATWPMIADYRYTTLDSDWVVKSDIVATVIYAFEWSGKVGDKPVGGTGRGTRVVTRDASGWRIAHEHISPGAWKA